MLAASDRADLCGGAPGATPQPCPVRASWKVDCQRFDQFSLAVAPDGRVLAAISAPLSTFVLQAAADGDASLEYLTAVGQPVQAAFTRQPTAEPRLFSSYRSLRRVEGAWRGLDELATDFAGVVGVAFTQGEAGFVLRSLGYPEQTLSLDQVPFTGTPSLTIARGELVYQQLLLTPRTRQPVVVYAEYRDQRLYLRQWTRDATVDLTTFESPAPRDLAFSAAIGADERPTVQYNRDGDLLSVRAGGAGPVFTAPPWTAPSCGGCSPDDGSYTYNQTAIGERASPLHALAGGDSLWSFLVTGPGQAACEAHGCSNEVVLSSYPTTVRLRRLGAAGPDYAFAGWRPGGPVALQTDGRGLLYLAWRDYGTLHVVVIDPAAR
jgi:hypothetical protein